MRLHLAVALALGAVACSGPISDRAAHSGEAIAFGAGPSGARDACFTCHGLEGEGVGANPRLAGLNAGYLAKQLFDYAQETRRDPIMTPIARAMTDRDRRAVSEYYAAMPSPESPEELPALYLHGDPSRDLRACADCHGRNALGLGPGYPALAGQPAEYTITQLRRFKYGQRRNDPLDVMGVSARELTEEEIAALARYLEN